MTLFFRLLKPGDKGTALQQAIQQLAEKQPNANTFVVEPESFKQVPGAPFAYWVSEEIRTLFSKLPQLENQNRSVRVGLQTSDDDRFLRAAWEVEPRKIVSGTAETDVYKFKAQTVSGKQWVFFPKGGKYSPYFQQSGQFFRGNGRMRVSGF